jgi:hypothetical protein
MAGRYIAIEPSGSHGWYIEDNWTGQTVCDFYVKTRTSFAPHASSEVNAKRIAQWLNDHEEI